VRISIFLDGANFFYMQKDRLHWWVDPKKFRTWAGALGTVVDAFYYVAEDPEPEHLQDNFFKALTYMGYTLKKKELRLIDGEKRRCNLEIEIVHDMILYEDTYDTAILVSGSEEYKTVLETLRTLGKRIVVCSTQGFVSRKIREILGQHFVDFQDIRGKVEKISEDFSNANHRPVINSPLIKQD